MRTVPPSYVMGAYKAFDQLQFDCLQSIITSRLSLLQWQQCGLPTSRGGLGTRHCAFHAPGAFLASRYAYQAFVRHNGIDTCNDQFIETTEMLYHETMFALNPNWKRTLPEGMKQKDFADILNTMLWRSIMKRMSSLEDRAVFQCISGRKASSYLNAIPSPGMGQHLTNAEFVVTMRLRFNLDVFAQDSTCICGDMLNTFHALTCIKDRYATHNAIRNQLAVLCTQGLLHPEKEKAGLIPPSDEFPDEPRPADVYLPVFLNGRDVCIDVARTNPLQDKYIQSSANQCGAAADHYAAFVKETPAMLKRCKKQHLEFVAFVMESYGAFSLSAIHIADQVASHIAVQRGIPFAQASAWTFQRLNITLHRFQARSILQRRMKFGAPVDAAIEFNSNGDLLVRGE